MAGKGGASQVTRKRLYHWSDTLRLLGAERGTKIRVNVNVSDYLFISAYISSYMEDIRLRLPSNQSVAILSGIDGPSGN